MLHDDQEDAVRVMGFALDLVEDPAMIAEYERHHERIWPELVHAMKAIGVLQQQIFRSGSRLFMIIEVPDDFVWDERFGTYIASTPKAAEWDRLMRKLQRPVPAAKPGEWWSQMSEIYNLNDQLRMIEAER
jgi:L-rhamnose mutarotase